MNGAKPLARGALIGAAALVFALLAPPVAPRAADPQPYQVTIPLTGDAALDSALQQSSDLVGLRASAPVGPFALAGRAQGDVARLQVALRSFGYYAGQVHITIAGLAADDPALLPLLEATPSGTIVPVQARITLGPLFRLRHVTIDGTVPSAVAAKLAPVAPGAPAVAADVLAAATRLLAALQDAGYALAQVDQPRVIEDPAARVLDVTYKVRSGPRVALGPIALAGLGRVDEDFVRRRLLVHQGEAYSPAVVEAARADLASVGVFATVRAQLADRPDAQGQLPLTFAMTPAKRHVVAFTAAFSTDIGGSLGVTWTDRNLFGAAEQLKLSATATQLGGSSTNQPGYELGAELIKPDFLQRDQSLQFDLNGFKEDLDAYSRTGASAAVTLNRKLAPHWTVSAGLSLVDETVKQEEVTRAYILLAAPLGLRFDSTDSLLMPTRGIRAAATVTPTESLSGRDATFVLLNATASTYLDLAPLGTAPGRSVIALRGLVGSAQGATQFDLPPDQRFYAGGSTTVRGYKYQGLGPLFADDRPQGGAAVDTATVEFRQRLLTSWGAAAFLDAGQISTGSAPFTGAVHLGAGVGARYYTAIGPIRLDVAVPLNRQPGGDSFELYIGLGEAF